MGIGLRIKQRREALGMTQEELALAIGYTSKSTVNKIEKEINDIPQSKIKLFAQVLRTSPGFLLGFSDVNDTNDDYVDILFNDGTSATVTSNNKQFLTNIKLWVKEFGKVEFSSDEIQDIIDYGKFILMKRK